MNPRYGLPVPEERIPDLHNPFDAFERFGGRMPDGGLFRCKIVKRI